MKLRDLRERLRAGEPAPTPPTLTERRTKPGDLIDIHVEGSEAFDKAKEALAAMLEKPRTTKIEDTFTEDGLEDAADAFRYLMEAEKKKAKEGAFSDFTVLAHAPIEILAQVTTYFKANALAPSDISNVRAFPATAEAGSRIDITMKDARSLCLDTNLILDADGVALRDDYGNLIYKL